MKFHLCPFATGVDIHILDVVPDDPVLERQQDILIATANTLSHTWGDPGKPEKDKMETYRKLEADIGVQLDQEMPVCQRLMILSDLAMGMYSSQNSGKVAFIPVKQKARIQLFEPGWFGEPVYMPFEGFLVPVPEYYNLLLELIFGKGYLIPYKTGGMHGYPFYRKQYDVIKQMFEKEGEKLPDFLSE